MWMNQSLSIQSKSERPGHTKITFTVTDTGVGIKKESIPHLFNAFRRVDEKNNRYIEGTGLGLAIVKQLVDLMGGDITVNSVYTKGSSFTITLPQQIAGKETIGKFDFKSKDSLAKREIYKQSFEAPKAHVLIVDDNETNLMVTKKLLSDTKIQVDTVLSGKDCLKRTFENRYDVILMDHFMPNMDGIECLHEIRNQTGGLNQRTPVVILTANGGTEYQELYRREGFDGYLLKPVTGIQLETELLKQLPKELVTVTTSDGSVGVIETPTVAYKKKKSVLISTDSVCDLPKNLVDKAQVEIMPYRVHTDRGEFLDGIETEADAILSYLVENGNNVRSEAPTVADYEKFFADQLTKAQYIVHLSMSTNVSHGYRNALEASKTFDNVIVIDSEHLSSGLGIMALRAAEYAMDGLDADYIVKKIEDLKSRVRTSFILDNTEYLSRSGRISSKIHIFCKALMLHPVLVLKNNTMKLGSIRVGTKDYASKKYISSVLSNPETIDTSTLFITYAGLSQNELMDIEAQVRSKVKFQKVIFSKASPAISTNCGPGSFGLIFMMK